MSWYVKVLQAVARIKMTLQTKSNLYENPCEKEKPRLENSGILYGKIRTFEEICDTITSAATMSYDPISHAFLAREIYGSLVDSDFTIRAITHTLNRDGSQEKKTVYFAIFQISPHDPEQQQDWDFVICASNCHRNLTGTRITSGIVTDFGYAFDEELLFRKNTRNLLRDIKELLPTLPIKIIACRSKFDDRIRAYRKHELKQAELNDFLVRAAQAGAISPRHLLLVANYAECGRFENPTAWNLLISCLHHHNQYVKDAVALITKTRTLITMMDAQVGIAT